MQLQITTNGKIHHIDTSKAISIGIPVNFGPEQLQAFYIDSAQKKSFEAGGFIGNVALGGACNVEVLTLTPHGNGTHTECVGHISKEPYYIHDCLKDLFCIAQLITVVPEKINEDLVITRTLLEEKKIEENALMIRTLPNEKDKLTKHYSGTNPAYFDPEAMAFMVEKKIQHLVTDLPSVDKEDDGGVLGAHHTFWNYPDAPRTEATITELVFISNEIPDGKYLLQFSFSPLMSDASPSDILLYRL